MKYYIFAVLILEILTLIKAKDVFAVDYFEDDFSSGNLSKWIYEGSQNNDFYVEKFVLVGNEPRRTNSFLYAKDFVGKDYTVELDAKNLVGVDQELLLRVSEDRQNYYMVDFRYNDKNWAQDCNNITLWKKVNGSWSFLYLVDSSTLKKDLDLKQNVWHRIKVELVQNNINVFYDGLLVMSYRDNTGYPFLAGGFGFQNWSGDYNNGNVINNFDNIKIKAINNNFTRKVVIIPGLGASWNNKALLLNENVGADDWKMTPFVNIYDDLVAAFEEKGLVKNKDFYIWNYDWRKPIAGIEEDLNKFIDKVISKEEKVDLVGHSLGGLTARIWAQNHINDPRVGKIISLGGPQFGVVKAYEAWNGAKISDKFDLGSIGLNVLLQLQKNKLMSDVDTIRNFAPVIKDLLPVFDFIKIDNTNVSTDKLSTINSYLTQNNLGVSNLFEKFKAVSGVGYSTVETLSLKERSVFNKVLNMWPDGKPESYTLANGDGTVLEKSAMFKDDSGGYDQVSAPHSLMVTKSINSVFKELDLGSVSEKNYENINRAKLVFYMGSPAEMTVVCDGNTVKSEDEMGFIVINNDNYNECSLRLLGTGYGRYHLVLGRNDSDDDWHYIEDSIGLGQTITMIIDPNRMEIAAKKENRVILWQLVTDDINWLAKDYKNNQQLLRSMEAANLKKLTPVTEHIFNFRKETKEFIISNRIIERLQVLLAIENLNVVPQQAKAKFLVISNHKADIDRRGKLDGKLNKIPGRFESESEIMMEKLFNLAYLLYQSNRYGESFAASKIAEEYAREVL